TTPLLPYTTLFRSRPIDAEKRLLDEVARVRFVARHPVGDIIDMAGIPLDDRLVVRELFPGIVIRADRARSRHGGHHGRPVHSLSRRSGQVKSSLGVRYRTTTLTSFPRTTITSWTCMPS